MSFQGEPKAGTGRADLGRGAGPPRAAPSLPREVARGPCRLETPQPLSLPRAPASVSSVTRYFRQKTNAGRDHNPALPRPAARRPPAPQRRPAETTAASKAGLGKHDAKQNVQLLLLNVRPKQISQSLTQSSQSARAGAHGGASRPGQGSRQFPKKFYI